MVSYEEIEEASSMTRLRRFAVSVAAARGEEVSAGVKKLAERDVLAEVFAGEGVLFGE